MPVLPCLGTYPGLLDGWGFLRHLRSGSPSASTLARAGRRSVAGRDAITEASTRGAHRYFRHLWRSSGIRTCQQHDTIWPFGLFGVIWGVLPERRTLGRLVAALRTQSARSPNPRPDALNRLLLRLRQDHSVSPFCRFGLNSTPLEIRSKTVVRFPRNPRAGLLPLPPRRRQLHPLQPRPRRQRRRRQTRTRQSRQHRHHHDPRCHSLAAERTARRHKALQHAHDPGDLVAREGVLR